MSEVRRQIIAPLALFLTCGIAPHVAADELTMAVERDLAALGYDTGPVDGQETLETVIAVSKFQAQHQLEVTGEITPQLAGMLAARASGRAESPITHAAPAAAGSPAGANPAARQACLQAKVEAAQEAQKTKRGLSRLMSAVVRTATRQGNPEAARAANELYAANATAEDLTAVARDLGLTDDDLAECDTAGGQP
jgi:peptidoglycan hydrolase-like protein with peptidoglycan-binding domain